jgi:hypothetical protein
LDRSGKYLTVSRSFLAQTAQPKVDLLDFATGKFVGPGYGRGSAPHMPLWVDPYEGGLSFARRGSNEPILVLGIDARPTGIKRAWTTDGNRYAWGTADGAVHVADLVDMDRRLTRMGLGW